MVEGTNELDDEERVATHAPRCGAAPDRLRGRRCRSRARGRLRHRGGGARTSRRRSPSPRRGRGAPDCAAPGRYVATNTRLCDEVSRCRRPSVASVAGSAQCRSSSHQHRMGEAPRLDHRRDPLDQVGPLGRHELHRQHPRGWSVARRKAGSTGALGGHRRRQHPHTLAGSSPKASSSGPNGRARSSTLADAVDDRDHRRGRRCGHGAEHAVDFPMPASPSTRTVAPWPPSRVPLDVRQDGGDGVVPAGGRIPSRSRPTVHDHTVRHPHFGGSRHRYMPLAAAFAARWRLASRAADRGAVEVSGAVRSVDGDDPVFVECQSPASLVHEMVMAATKWEQIVQIGAAVRSHSMTWWMSQRWNTTSQPG